jgi:predicted dehydrogenase/threonine dehydrogenase-like Zn-dependent dehydrogenase
VKQVAQCYRTGELTLVDVPVPMCAPGGLLVRTEYSLISPGTELMKVEEAGRSMLGKVRARPDQVRRVLDTVAQQGPHVAFKKAMNQLESYTPLGYSLCGTVVEVGDGVTDLAIGQRVACAGNQFALHSELNWIPVNLCAVVPDEVASLHAAFTTVGAIALQGLRQAELGLGDVAVVIGLGLVGQLLVQLLDAAGVRTLGIDVSEARCQLAATMGTVTAARPESLGGLTGVLSALTGGAGADAVFLAAGSTSNEPVETAARVARDRARVIDIGKCSLDLPWSAFYEKELDVRFSRSYGPGRYDPTYELAGVDYPIGYVRWTEGRNLACFLDLVARARVSLEPLVSGVVPFADAVSTYERMRRGELDGIGFVFEYPADVPIARVVSRSPRRERPPAPAVGRTIRVGFVGAGSHASTMLLPTLAKRDDLTLATVATSSSLSCVSAQRRFGFGRATTDHRELIEDPNIDAVFIVTRHSSHARLVIDALRAGKSVFVEKPLAITRQELHDVVQAVVETGNDRLQVGFNRRFAPMLVELRHRFGPRSRPAVCRYLVNAGSLPPGSWYGDEANEGGRFLGEGGHFIDTLAWWLGADPVAVSAERAGGSGDDRSAFLTFADGSTADLVYATRGPARFPKETFDVLADGKAARLDNFRWADVWDGRRHHRRRRVLGTDKGQAGELTAFLEAARTAAPMPIPLSTLVSVTQATLAVEEALTTDRRISLAPLL